jgi:hypothetical protein
MHSKVAYREERPGTRSGTTLLRLWLVALLILGCVSVWGCGDEDEILAPPPPDPYPLNKTPRGAIQRFVAVYEAKDSTAYSRLFTGDFRFEFSNSADPDLANEYASGWFKEDEQISATNLFRGGVNNDGVFQAGALSIDLALIVASPQGDTAMGRDSTKSKYLFTPVNLTIQLPPSADDPEGSTFVVGGADPAVHRFFLVRGDAANSLSTDQPADAAHWYIWYWRDESTVTSRSEPPSENELYGETNHPRMVESKSNTWGQVKGLYR